MPLQHDRRAAPRFWGGIAFYLVYSLRQRDEVYSELFLNATPNSPRTDLIELGRHLRGFRYSQ